MRRFHLTYSRRKGRGCIKNKTAAVRPQVSQNQFSHPRLKHPAAERTNHLYLLFSAVQTEHIRCPIQDLNDLPHFRHLLLFMLPLAFLYPVWRPLCPARLQVSCGYQTLPVVYFAPCLIYDNIEMRAVDLVGLVFIFGIDYRHESGIVHLVIQVSP